MNSIRAKAKAAVRPAEYSVYVYHYLEEDRDGHCTWEKVKTTVNKHRAVKNAEKLHKSRKYQKVEIKKRIYGLHFKSF